MKKVLLVLLSISILTATTSYSKEITQNGNTEVVATVNSAKIKVFLKTAIVATPTSIKPFYEKKLVSIVEELSINFNGQSLFIPRSVFSDLYDVKTAVINKGKRGALLKLSGADASNAYNITIYFDNNKVSRRTVIGGESDIITEDTKYSLVIVE